MDLTVGADPEFPLVNKAGHAVSAHHLLPIKAEAGRWVTVDGYDGIGYKLYRDGFGAEVNIRPGHCRENMTLGVHAAVYALLQKAKAKGYTVGFKASMPVSTSVLARCPGDVSQFGCEPSLNAYTARSCLVDLYGPKHPRRYFGAHFHLGTEETGMRLKKIFSEPEVASVLVKYLDLYIGTVLVILGDSMIGAGQRRKYYGKAGEFRIQHYNHYTNGIEYRTPAPDVWRFPPLAFYASGVMRRVFEEFVNQPTRFPDMSSRATEQLQHAINSNSVDACQEIVPKQFPKFLGEFMSDSTAKTLGIAARALRHFRKEAITHGPPFFGKPRTPYPPYSRFIDDAVVARPNHFGWSELLYAGRELKKEDA